MSRTAKKTTRKKKLTAKSTGKPKTGRKKRMASLKPEEKEFFERVGVNIARLRKSRGWPQDWFEQIGIGLRDFQRIEAGEQNLTFRVLLRIAQFLSVDASELVKPLDIEPR